MVAIGQTAALAKPMPRHIAVVRALPGLGDMLCAVPAFRALRSGLPDAHITLIGLPWARAFVQRFHKYVNAFLEFPGYPGIPEVPVDVRRLPLFLSTVQQLHFDLALQMHGSGIATNPFAVLLGARLTAGYYLPGQYCPDPWHFLPYPEDEPEVWRNLHLIKSLGLPPCGEALEFPLLDSDFAELQTVAEAENLRRGRYVCVHPGARDSARRWSPRDFAAAADALAGEGYQIVLTGTRSEAELTRAVASAARAPVVDLAGKTSLGALAALLDGARLLLCNDTGVSHLAAALQVPSVVIFTASDPARWAPLDRRRHRVIHSGYSAQRRSPVPQVLHEAQDLLQNAEPADRRAVYHAG